MLFYLQESKRKAVQLKGQMEVKQAEMDARVTALEEMAAANAAGIAALKQQQRRAEAAAAAKADAAAKARAPHPSLRTCAASPRRSSCRVPL